MKSIRLLILLVIVVLVLVGIRFWPHKKVTPRADTPAECIENYFESLKNGDIEKYLRCLGEPDRTEAGQQVFDAACRDVRDVKGLVQHAGPVEPGASRWVDVEEIRAAGVRRLRYHLRQQERGWLIVAIDPPRETTSPIRYGTPVGEEP